MEIAHLKAAVERTKQTLERRTERWIAHNEKRDEYIMRIKKALAHLLAVLKRTHEEDMAAQEARQYHITHRQWFYCNARIHLCKLEGKPEWEHTLLIEEVRNIMLVDSSDLLPCH